MDEYRFDDDGGPCEEPTQDEIDSPAVDQFTRLMEDGVEAALAADDAADSMTIVRVRSEIVTALQDKLSAAVQAQVVEGPLLHREAHLAFANAFLWVANSELTGCDLDTFQPNKDAIMHVIAILATAILDARPGHAHLVDAKPATSVVQ